MRLDLDNMDHCLLRGAPGGGAWVSFNERVERVAQADPDRIAYVFLKNGEVEDCRLSYGALFARARRIAAALVRRAGPAPRVLLLFPQGPDFILGFMSALLAGGVAVPAPNPQGKRGTRARLQAIARNVSPDAVLTLTDLAEQAGVALEGCGVPAPLALADLEQEPASTLPEPRPDDVALIQYTSGSTGDPKGVVITHGNMMANMALIRERFSHSEETVTVNWLPVFHDMGLVGGTLHPLYLGSLSVMMSPVAFLQDPSRWLQAITDYGGNTSGAPNFAYDYCASRIAEEKKARLDLSSWTCAFNGSEPVRAATLDRFHAAFAGCGFRREAFYPTYGMAEATLLISGGDRSAPPVHCATADGIRVASGVTGAGHEVLIVDPDTRRILPERATGEIWVAGPSISPGYLDRPEVNAEVFGQSAEGRQGSYMRTGDLGFFDGGQLFVTGRIKDVLIVRGRNHYPHDIEAAAQASHPALRADSGAAFLAQRGEEEALVIVNEVERGALRDVPPVKEIAAAVRAEVSEMHGLHAAAVVLLRTGGIPKTSSGKVRRRMTRELYLGGGLPLFGEDRHGGPFDGQAEQTHEAAGRPPNR